MAHEHKTPITPNGRDNLTYATLEVFKSRVRGYIPVLKAMQSADLDGDEAYALSVSYMAMRTFTKLPKFMLIGQDMIWFEHVPDNWRLLEQLSDEELGDVMDYVEEKLDTFQDVMSSGAFSSIMFAKNQQTQLLAEGTKEDMPLYRRCQVLLGNFSKSGDAQLTTLGEVLASMSSQSNTDGPGLGQYL